MAVAFSVTVLRYGATVLPTVRRELSRWRERALDIPDEVLRGHALEALGKRGNMEGAAFFAVSVPRAARARTARALVAFQAAYNYLDALAEQPSVDPVANGRALHEALLDALDPQPGAPLAAHRDYYAQHPRREDGGYLHAMVDACRACLAGLPSYELVAPAARAAAGRIVEFQSLNLGERQGGTEGLERWARAQTPVGCGLQWWETAAAGGSSLGVHALIGRAAESHLDAHEIPAAEAVYFPWLGALHSLLDSTVDIAEDREAGQRNLLSYYASPAQAASRIGWLAGRAREETRRLACRGSHPRDWPEQAIVTALPAYYLSSPTVSSAGAEPVTRSVADALGRPTTRTLALFRGARVASHLAGGRMVHG